MIEPNACWWCGVSPCTSYASVSGLMEKYPDGNRYCSWECFDHATQISNHTSTRVITTMAASDTETLPAKDNDPVEHPAHYRKGKIEVIELIEAVFADNYHLGNVVKYLCRHKHKGKPLEDLKKARWYLDRYINFVGSK